MTTVKITAVVVLHAFGPYAKGEIISDPSVIAVILNGGNARLVVPTNLQRSSVARQESREG